MSSAHTDLLIHVIKAAILAGNEILKVYNTDFAVEHKSDSSPLTIADQRSHNLIVEHLGAFNLPILSEEGRDVPYSTRKAWDRFWLIDPLDGTKEFVKRNDEFTVNIALIEAGHPVLGVIFVPVSGDLYMGAAGFGSYRLSDDEIIASFSSGAEIPSLDRITGNAQRLPDVRMAHSSYTIVGSRSHATPELQAFIEEKKAEMHAVDFISCGSSIKLCAVAEGRADIYPRLGPTMEWDTGAGQAIAENAGATVLHYDSNEPLAYNKPNLLNPWFVVSR